MRGWTVRDSAELYNVANWGAGFFTVNDQGRVEVRPNGNGGPGIDLLELVGDLERRGLRAPLLVRFSDILKSRVAGMCGAFEKAIAEYGYKGGYRGVYPIKVNQQRHVVEEIVEYGAPYGVGLEAGSKPELLISLALLDTPNALIICNGYKDRALHRDGAPRAASGPHADHRRRSLPRARSRHQDLARPRHPAAYRRARALTTKGRGASGSSRPATVRSSA